MGDGDGDWRTTQEAANALRSFVFVFCCSHSKCVVHENLTEIFAPVSDLIFVIVDFGWFSFGTRNVFAPSCFLCHLSLSFFIPNLTFPVFTLHGIK